MAKCRSCEALIDWVEMESGRKMPVDRMPRPYWAPLPGQTLVVKVVGKPAFVVVAPTDQPLIKVGVSHFATCPDSKTWRKEDS